MQVARNLSDGQLYYELEFIFIGYIEIHLL